MDIFLTGYLLLSFHWLWSQTEKVNKNNCEQLQKKMFLSCNYCFRTDGKHSPDDPLKTYYTGYAVLCKPAILMKAD